MRHWISIFNIFRFYVSTKTFQTRIKATRCETLRTVKTNNSKKTLKFDLLPQCIINGPKVNGYNFFHFWTHFIDSPWKRSILIRHNQYWNSNFKMSSQNGSPEPKVSSYNFFHFWPHFIDCAWKRSILILKRWGRNRYFSLTCNLCNPVIFTNQHCFTNQ